MLEKKKSPLESIDNSLLEKLLASIQQNLPVAQEAKPQTRKAAVQKWSCDGAELDDWEAIIVDNFSDILLSTDTTKDHGIVSVDDVDLLGREATMIKDVQNILSGRLDALKRFAFNIMESDGRESLSSYSGTLTNQKRGGKPFVDPELIKQHVPELWNDLVCSAITITEVIDNLTGESVSTLKDITQIVNEKRLLEYVNSGKVDLDTLAKIARRTNETHVFMVNKRGTGDGETSEES